MKNASEHAKTLRKLIDRHKPAKPPEDHADPLDQLIYSFLLWETTRKQADAAFNKLNKAIVDYNELRVSDPAEIVDAIGKRYSRAEERAIRLQAALNAIYVNEYAVTLAPLADKPKRQARQYLAELEGMTPFVSARVTLVSLGGHAMPVDEALAGRLKRDGAADAEATIEQTQAFLEKQVRSAEAKQVHAALLHYVENTPAPGRGKASGSSKSSASSRKSGSSKSGARSRSGAGSGKSAS